MDGYGYDRHIEDLERGAAGLERQLDRTEAELIEQQRLVRDYALENQHLHAQLEAMNADNTDLREQLILLKHEALVQEQERCDYDCDNCRSDDFPGEEPEGMVGVVGIDNEKRPKLAKAFVVSCPVCGEVGRVPFEEWEEDVGIMGPKEQAFWDAHVAEKHPG